MDIKRYVNSCSNQELKELATMILNRNMKIYMDAAHIQAEREIEEYRKRYHVDLRNVL